ncbi:MAG: hypothetical protein CMP50_02960 [Flavobacteriales bacterium]|nr:hypothetical protein [Flavobacteriales bacterium]MBE37600.1 hypothetical protein [Flavobacteriales bacterium]|tara:strand:- start:34 stop:321 length:288 start_codon:yes stop_codon:yes gene_type:complete
MANTNNPIIQSALLLKSIGHPIRVSIIIELSKHSSMTVTQLSNYLSIDQPIMSLHLAILRKQHIIKVKKDGKNSFYSIEDIAIKQIVNLVYNTRQ